MKTLLDVFEQAANHPQQYFYTKDRHKYFRPEKFLSLYNKAQKIAVELIARGIQPGDRIALFADNRWEWLVADMAIQLAGGVVVPRGSDSTAAEMDFILGHSEARLVFFEHLRVFKKLSGVLKKYSLPAIVLDASFPKDNLSEEIISLHSLLAGVQPGAAELKQLQDIRRRLTGDDLFTIIYTSGTTGNPKGVMLSHANMLYQLQVVPQALDLKSSDRILSILPVWHIFERFMLYCVIDAGACYYYSSPKDLMEDFIRVKPTLMASAPRLWEQIYQKLHERIEKTENLNRELFEVSFQIKHALHRATNEISGNTFVTKPRSFWQDVFEKGKALLKLAALKLPDMYLDPIFLMRVRAMLGGELRGTISGGGALPPHIDEFFNAIGIPVYEGYGMTETSPLISMRQRGRVIEGSVGFCPPGTEVRIVKEDGSLALPGEQGEIHVRGPGVMKGYYKNPEATAKVLKDGWLNTGDLGVMALNGALSIRGRSKDTIVLLGGENVEPVPMETILTQHKLIEQAVVVGQDQKHLGVLIWPNYEMLEDAGFAVNEFDRKENLNNNKEIMKLYLNTVHELISEKNGFKPFERITAVRFLPDKLRVGDTLTNLMKIKRNVVHKKYADLIASMYRH